jgi:hypothetical protein
MRKTCSSGSVEGVMANHDPYSDRLRRPQLEMTHTLQTKNHKLTFASLRSAAQIS